MTIEKEVKVLISAVDEYSDGMLGFTSKAALVTAAVGAIATAMVAASIKAAEFATDLGSKVWTSATDFHDAIVNVDAVAQNFGTTTGEISGILDDLTQKFPVTGAAAGASMQLIAQLGYGSADKLRDMSDAANTLQVATGADLQTAVMGTLSLLNSYNLESTEATRIINLLAAASFSSAANIDDLGIALRYAAPITSLMGVSVEETVAAIAKLRDRGLEASQAGTTLRMALIQLGHETKDKTELLAKYGLTYADVNPQVVGLTGVIKAFNGQLIDGQDAAVLFGTRSVAMANIINMGSEAFGAYTKSITGTSAAQDAMIKKLETWKVVQANVIGNVDLFQKTIAGGLVPEILHYIGTTESEGLRGVINYLTKLENAHANMNETVTSIYDQFKATVSESFGSYFNNVEGLYNYLSLIVLALGENVKIVMEWASVWGGIGIKMTNDLDSIKTALHIVNGSFFLVSGSIALVHDAFAGMANVWMWSFAQFEAGFYRLQLALNDIGMAILETLDRLPWLDMSEEVLNLENHMVELRDKIEQTLDKPYYEMWSDDVAKGFYKVSESIESMEGPAAIVKSRMDDYGLATLDNVRKVKELEKGLLAVDETQKKVGESWADYVRRIDSNLNQINKSEREYVDGLKAAEEPLNKNLDRIIATTKNTIDAKNASEAMVKVVKDGQVVWTQYTVETEKAKSNVDDLNKSVDDMSDNEFKIYTEKFKADLALVAQESKQTFELVKTNMEWTAKVDIEKVKASAEILKAAFDSAGKSVEATADASASMVDNLTTLLTSDKWISESEKSWVQKMARDQLELQKKALENQAKLTEAEVRNLDAKTERIKNLDKEALIKVDGDGLKPHLEAMMWEVFEAIQIRATQEGIDKLLLGATLTT